MHNIFRKAKRNIMIMVILALAVPTLMDAGTGTALAQGVTIPEISASSPSSTYGKDVTFTATVADPAIDGTSPTGTATFMDGDQILATVALSATEPEIKIATTTAEIPPGYKNGCIPGPNGTAQAPCPIIQWGQYTYWAYSASDNSESMLIVAYDASGNMVKQWAKGGARYLWQITTDADNIIFWGQGNKTITLSQSEFLSTPVTASFTTSDLGIGGHSITAVYSGDNNHAASTSPVLNHTVSRMPSFINLSSSHNPSLKGDPIDFVAAVTSSAGDSITGTVDFMYGEMKPLGSAIVDDEGNATLRAVSSLPAGMNLISAVYRGDDLHADSGTANVQIVDLNSSMIRLTSSSPETMHGGPVILTAEVSSADRGTATGSVVFRDGDEQIGQASLSNGKASFTTSGLGIGEHSLTAAYEGDDTFYDSVSDAVSLKVHVSTLATLTSAIGKVSTGGTSQETIKDIPYGTALAAFKAAITPAAHAVFEVYDADGTHVAQTLNTGKKVLVTAEDGMTQVTYTVSLLGPAQAPSETPSTGGGTPSANGGGSPKPNNAPVTSNNGQLTLPAGRVGEVSLGNGITISIPANATVKDLQLIIKKVQDTLNLLKNSEILASPVYELEKNFAENFNSPITLTFAFDPSVIQDQQEAAVFYYDEANKNWVKVGGKVVGNQITVDVNHFTKFAVLATQQTTTINVNVNDIAGHWAEANIQSAIASGIVKGYTDGTFKPNATVTRAEFAVMLMNALKPQREAGTLSFTDDATIDAWARTAVAQAVQAGIVTGYQDGAFHPNDPITRAEMAVMLAKASGMATEGHAATRFADDKDIAAWAKGGVLYAQEAGLMQGKGNNRFAPQDQATRAEAVTVLLNRLAQTGK